MTLSPVFVEIADEPVIEARTYTKDGKTGIIPAKQKAYLHHGTRYPLETEISLEGVPSPFKPGRYLLGGECFENRATQRGYVQIGFNQRGLRLVSIEDALAFFNDGEVIPLAGKKAA